MEMILAETSNRSPDICTEKNDEPCEDDMDEVSMLYYGETCNCKTSSCLTRSCPCKKSHTKCNSECDCSSSLCKND